MNGKCEWKGGVEAIVPLELDSDREPGTPKLFLLGPCGLWRSKEAGKRGDPRYTGLAVCVHKH